MNYLFDTHTYIGFDSQPEKLSTPVRDICQDKAHLLHLSTAGIWEMQIKIQLGKLNVPGLHHKIANQLALNQVKILPIELTHIYDLARLPPGKHRDPFDRVLVAQAVDEGLPILSTDPLIAQNPVKTVW